MLFYIGTFPYVLTRMSHIGKVSIKINLSFSLNKFYIFWGIFLLSSDIGFGHLIEIWIFSDVSFEMLDFKTIKWPYFQDKCQKTFLNY